MEVCACLKSRTQHESLCARYDKNRVTEKDCGDMKVEHLEGVTFGSVVTDIDIEAIDDSEWN